MVPVLVIVVVLAIAGGVAFVVTKGKKGSGEFLSADAPASRPTTVPAAKPAVPDRPVVASTPAPTAPDTELGPDPDLDSLVFADPEPAAAPAAEPAPEPVAEVAPAVAEPVEPAPAALPAEDRPEPMVRARIAPAAAPAAPVHDAVDDDDDSAVLSRFKAPGARVASIPIPAPTETRPDPEPVAATPEPVVAAPEVVEPESEVVEPEVVAEAAEPEVVEPEVVEPEVVEPEVVAAEAPEPEPAAVAEAPIVADEPAPAAVVDDDEIVVSLVDEPAEPAVVDAGAGDLAAVTGSAGMSPVLEDPIVLTDEPAPPVAQLQPEPELDPVDHVLKALISRAKEKQVGIAEVAAELVEQANLEDRDIDEVLADLVVRADDDTVDPSERLEELTLFNDSVPRRPGQLTDFDRLDKNARKKVIIRVLCLLVAMQEDNRLKPSEPRSEAETRHWPLARAVWPVPVADADEAGDEADGDKKLPGRRLARTSTKR